MGVEQISSTNNQQITDYDVSKFLLGGNEFVDIDLTASGEVVLLEGMIMGKVGATGLLLACDKDATDGSQFPVGVVVQAKTIADTETKSIRLVNKGSIAEDKLNFLDTETLDTLIGAANNQRSYRDYMNDLGLILKTGVELTAVDNR